MEDHKKCLSLGSLVRLTDGTLEYVDRLTTDHCVMGLDGNAKGIIEVVEKKGELYKIIHTREKGEKTKLSDDYVVSSDHKLTLKFTNVGGIYWDDNRKRYKVRCIQNLKNENDENADKKFEHYAYLRQRDKIFSHGKTKRVTKNSKRRLYQQAEEFLEGKRDETGYYRGGDVIEISVDDYLKLPKNIKRALYDFKQEVNFEAKEVKIDPYILGLWLGDGTSVDSSITSMDDEIINTIYYYADMNNMRVTCIKKYNYEEGDEKGEKIRVNANCHKYRIAGDPDNIFLTALRQYDLLNNKHIPDDYLNNDRETRLQLLAGLLDTDGYLHNNCYEIAQKSDNLAADIVTLCRSLGFRISNNKRSKTCYKPNGEKIVGVYNVMQISGRKSGDIPVLLDRKKATPIKEANKLISRFKIEKCGVGEYVKFKINSDDGRFFGPDFTVY